MGCIRSKYDTNKRMAGFSLVELGIVMVISGLLTVTVAGGYSSYVQGRLTSDTVTSINAVEAATVAFFKAHGRYPCPAPRNATSGDAGYGRESCAAGAGVIQAPGKDADGDGTPDNILIGAVPFLTLGLNPATWVDGNGKCISSSQCLTELPPRDSMDGWGRRLSYAVTQNQTNTTPLTFNSQLGAVFVRQADGVTSVLAGTPEAGLHLVVVSHGVDGRGGFDNNGQLMAACGATGIDPENCDDDAVFIATGRSMGVAASYFDDYVGYQVWATDSLWAPTAADPNNIHNLNPGNIGVGTTNPTERLDIIGNLRADQFHTTQVCDITGADCFTPATIGGLGALCNPANQFFAGLSLDAAVCAPYPNGPCSDTNPVIAITAASGVLCAPSTLIPPPPIVACPLYTMWNPVTGVCDPPPPAPCPANSTYNAGTGLCECDGGYVWNGGTGTCDAPLVNGVCGAADGTTVAVAPVAPNLCAAGTDTAVVPGIGIWTWNCLGIAGGTDALGCKADQLVAPPPVCPANSTWNAGLGVCVCNSPYCPANATWNNATAVCDCDAGYTFNAANAACEVAVNGVCGVANGVTVAAAPVAGLCTTGTASAVTGAGPWTWNCVGSGSGSSAACAAPSVASVQITTGHSHTCRIKADGSLMCWGSNSEGQSNVPGGFAPWKTVEGGYRHTCGVTVAGVGVCWGRNAEGQLNIPGPAGPWRNIEPHAYHTCGVRMDGTAACWGNNTYGRTSIPDAGPWASMTLGVDHTCGVRTNGTAACWGRNQLGQTNIPDAGPWQTVVAGHGDSCGVRTNGTAACWGDNTFGQANIPDAGPWRSISLDDVHTCGVRLDNTGACWGINNLGQRIVPDAGPWQTISAGSGHTCGMRTDSTMACWGGNASGQTTIPP